MAFWNPRGKRILLRDDVYKCDASFNAEKKGLALSERWPDQHWYDVVDLEPYQVTSADIDVLLRNLCTGKRMSDGLRQYRPARRGWLGRILP